MLTVIDAILCDAETRRPVEMLPNVWPAGDLPELDYLHALIDCADVTEDARQDAHDRAPWSCWNCTTSRAAGTPAGMDPEPLLDVLPRVLDDFNALEALRA